MREKAGLSCLSLTWYLGVIADFRKGSEKDRSQAEVRFPFLICSMGYRHHLSTSKKPAAVATARSVQAIDLHPKWGSMVHVLNVWSSTWHITGGGRPLRGGA